ncbi:MAG TPA: LysR family transcriptional regulator [Myxococcaceae bacterium]|nr:LysR family transcriptional regulator [Myxococcaceae bacterium]
MELDGLRALVAFAEAGCNLTRSGRAVGLSQPAMHARLQTVARELEVTLYERRGRTLQLTSEGGRVLAWARDVLEREQSLRAELHGGRATQRVVLACGEGALVHVVSGRLAALARARPGVLSFLVLDGPAAAAAVERGVAHLAVAAGPAGTTPGLRSLPLLTTPLLAVVARPHPLSRAGQEVEARTLLDHPLLLPPPGRVLRTTLEELAAAHGLSLRVAVEVTGWEAVCRLAALEVGVGLVNALVPTPELTRLAVRGLPSTTYRILLRRGRGTPLMEEVVEALRREPGTPSSR